MCGKVKQQYQDKSKVLKLLYFLLLEVPICDLSIIFFLTYAKTKINDQILVFDPSNTKGGGTNTIAKHSSIISSKISFAFILFLWIIFWLKIDGDAEEYFGTPCMLFRTLWQVTLLICHGSYFWPDSLLCFCTPWLPYKVLAIQNIRKGKI